MKTFLKFNPVKDNLDNNLNVVLFHVDVLKDKQKDYLDKDIIIKICLGKKDDLIDNFDARLVLPTTLNEINSIIENTVAKKFIKNSSIEIKSYLLNKNEKTIQIRQFYYSYRKKFSF